MTKRIAVLGCGWLGLPLADSLVRKGHLVKGSTTSEDKIPRLKSKSIRPYLISLSEKGISGDISGFLSDVDILIVNVPPKLRGKQSEDYVQKMKLLHNEVDLSDINNVIFVSSTSVYGTIEGEVIEETVPEPTNESGKQVLLAEAIFEASDNLESTIIRFGGLIGKDRHPVYRLSEKKELSNGNHFINLIHRLDCIRIIEFIIAFNWWGKILNGVYPYHPTKKEYYTAEAHKRNLQTPNFIEISPTKGKKVVPKALLNVKTFSFATSIRA